MIIIYKTIPSWLLSWWLEDNNLEMNFFKARAFRNWILFSKQKYQVTVMMHVGKSWQFIINLPANVSMNKLMTLLYHNYWISHFLRTNNESFVWSHRHTIKKHKSQQHMIVVPTLQLWNLKKTITKPLVGLLWKNVENRAIKNFFMPSELFFWLVVQTYRTATDLQSEKKNALLCAWRQTRLLQKWAPDVFVTQLLCIIFSSAQMIITTHECKLMWGFCC